MIERRSLLAGLAMLAACAKKPEEKRYKLTGDILRLDPQMQTAAIKGDKIEGWMDAMSMEYPVKDSQGFSTLHPNDCIDATVFVQGSEYWVGDVKHADAAPGACVPPKTPPKDTK